ncbi:MAG TPA: hypothetical protein VKQ28_04935 [Candidatus Acidoferrum sp.]|nr:hypothetical protein [Candidatus Acidoferrum sp.]
MVIHAERAHVGEAGASAGSTIFDGDRLSTEGGGLLRLAGPGLNLQLAEGSQMVLRRAPAPEGISGDRVEVELTAGTLVLSAAPMREISVLANDAWFRAASHSATVAHLRIVNRQELRVYAQRGLLQLSYHGDSETIQEGAAYRVLLDPSTKEISAISETNEFNKKGTRLHRTFRLVAIGVAAGVAIPVLIHELESPDRPGFKP